MLSMMSMSRVSPQCGGVEVEWIMGCAGRHGWHFSQVRAACAPREVLSHEPIPTRRQTPPSEPCSQFRANESNVVDELVKLSGVAGAHCTSTWATDGCVTFWSQGMEERYGFSRAQALGSVTFMLLRTILPQAQDAIEAEFVRHGTWTGGVIHHHADGRPILTMSRWDVHHDLDDARDLVSETHSAASDDADGHSVAWRVLTDLLAAMAHEFSEPLTALTNYNSAMLLLLQQDQPSRDVLRQAAARTAGQIARCTKTVVVLRELVKTMRRTDESRPV
jgi:signal transduction histidine kinase